MDTSKNNSDLLIQCKLTEYKELRAELNIHMQLQFTILALFVTAVGIFFNVLDVEAVIFPFLVSCIVPAASSLCGILWIDQILRQIRIGNHIYKIEQDLDKLISYDAETIHTKIIWWEHQVGNDSEPTRLRNMRHKKTENGNSTMPRKKCIKFRCIPLFCPQDPEPNKNSSQESLIKKFISTIKVFVNPNLFPYYVGLGAFITSPLLSFIALFMFNTRYLSLIEIICLCFGLFSYGLFIVFAFTDILEILSGRKNMAID